MEKIFVQVKNREKADLLIQFLNSLDFVEKVSNSELPDIKSDSMKKSITPSDFFALAGLWKGREISLVELRKKAWPVIQ